MHFHIPQRRPGAYADIIAVDGDPLRSIKALENVQWVMKDGKVFKSARSGNWRIGLSDERRFLVPAQL